MAADTRDRPIIALLTEKDRDRLRALAKADNRSVSLFAAMIIVAGLDRIEGEQAKREKK